MLCGIDEAGRGPVIGPLVVAGVLVEEQSVLKKMGVKDSKKLLKNRREELYEEITKVAKHFCVHVTAWEIDDMRKLSSLNDIEAEIFASVVEELCPEHTMVYVDAADVKEKRFADKIKTYLNMPVNIISKHGADDLFPVVSAASILAKVERDRAIAVIEEKLKIQVGSGYPSDKRTIAFLNDWVAEYGKLPGFARNSWKTSKKILNQNKNKKLDDF
ncbi:MAG: ribonuclease HII [Thermoplasmata archaeon]